MLGDHCAEPEMPPFHIPPLCGRGRSISKFKSFGNAGRSRSTLEIVATRDVVALRQLRERRRFRSPPCFSLFCGVEFWRPCPCVAPAPSPGFALDAVRVRIRSRSTSAKAPSTAIINRPVLVAVSAYGSASHRNCPPASVCLTMANRSEARAGQTIAIGFRSWKV